MLACMSRWALRVRFGSRGAGACVRRPHNHSISSHGPCATHMCALQTSRGVSQHFFTEGMRRPAVRPAGFAARAWGASRNDMGLGVSCGLLNAHGLSDRCVGKQGARRVRTGAAAAAVQPHGSMHGGHRLTTVCPAFCMCIDWECVAGAASDRALCAPAAVERVCQAWERHAPWQPPCRKGGGAAARKARPATDVCGMMGGCLLLVRAVGQRSERHRACFIRTFGAGGHGAAAGAQHCGCSCSDRRLSPLVHVVCMAVWRLLVCSQLGVRGGGVDAATTWGGSHDLRDGELPPGAGRRPQTAGSPGQARALRAPPPVRW